MKCRLHVCIPCRERLYTTEKCIQSIRKNSSQFDLINIYCFDNLSTLDYDNRFAFFSQLLISNEIQYYSYDTPQSLVNIFPKAIIYQRWIDMMATYQHLKTHQPTKQPYTNYYMLCDNDMIFGPSWDEPFISAIDTLATDFTHFAVKYPGGLPVSPHTATRPKTLHKIKNKFNPEQSIEVLSDSMTGSSGMWFMSYDMMTRTKWTPEQLSALFGKPYGDDIIMWNIIKQKQTKEKKEYLLRVKDIDPDNPTVIHIGDHVGSIVKENKKAKYNNNIIENHRISDLKLKDMSVEEVYNTYKARGCGVW
jgi:hypothetical protein